MLPHPTLTKLEQLRFHGMAGALREQLAMPEADQLSFMERLGLLLDHEASVRENERLRSRLRRARLRQDACMEDLDYRANRGLSKRLMLHLATGHWIRNHENVIVTGPTGVGKSFVACALGHKACLNGFTARYFRLPRLLEELAVARAEGRYLKVLRTLARLDVLVLDDWGLKRISTDQQEDLHELLDDRIHKRSTIATSQLPLDQWHAMMANPTLADAILDRLAHIAHRIALKGESMRKQLAKVSSPVHPTHA